MPYANNNGVRIYYEVEGKGPPLVMAHALGGDGMYMWRRDKYVEALRSDFQLILLDFRGHGQSDKPHEASACAISVLASDVLAILDDLKIDSALYWGYSLGSRVGFWLAACHADRFDGFILAGMTPSIIPEPTVKIAKAIQDSLRLLLTDPDGALTQREQRLGRPLNSKERESYLSQDAEAIIAMWTAWLESTPMTDEDLASISQPCLVFCGDADEGGFHPGAKECVRHMPNAKFISFPGLNHGTAFSRIDLVLPNVKEFLARVSKT